MDSPVVVPAGKVYKATATIKQTRMDIPYTGIVHYEGTTQTKSLTGIYHGVQFYDMQTVFTNITPP